MSDSQCTKDKKGEYYDGTTSDLNISGKNIVSCKDVVETLQKTGIMCSVVEQNSVICERKNCWIEKGCKITLSGLKPYYINAKVWAPLQQRFQLTCAHLHVHGQYRGCILDFLRTSHCSGPSSNN